MIPPRLIAVAVLGALPACGAVPTDGAAAADRATPAVPTVASDALPAIRDVIADPLVHALVAGLRDEGSRGEIDAALAAVHQAAAGAEPGTLDGALFAARREVGRLDDAAPRAALSLLLDHAEALTRRAAP